MMIKVEIYTDVGDYVVDVPTDDAATPMEAWKYVKDALAAGMPLEGVVRGALVGETRGLFSIEPGSVVKHILIRDDVEETVDLVAPPQPTVVKKQEGTGLYDFSFTVPDFLGTDLKVAGTALYDANHQVRYFMPTTINGDRALDVIGIVNLKRFVDNWAQQTVPPGDAQHIIEPPQGMDTLDQDEVDAFVMDYVADINKGQAEEPKGDGAKAWQGWKEGANHE